MADRHPANVAGDWFVDTTCIDCGHCRVHAPEVFGDAGGQAVVHRQPDAPEAASRALVSCPVGAIHGRPVRADLPVEVLPDVFLCGYASHHTYGATSWLVRRPEGNVLVDVPRPVKPLLDRIEALGGVRALFLTHRDDVHGHDAIARRFGCARVVHRADAVPGAEVLFDDDTRLDGLRVIATPGHTRGSACLLVGDVLFSGDHLWGRGDALHASRSVAWFSWAQQLGSLAKLVGVPFAHVLPGHGRPWHGTVEGKDAALRDLLSRVGASATAASPPAAAGG